MFCICVCIYTMCLLYIKYSCMCTIVLMTKLLTGWLIMHPIVLDYAQRIIAWSWVGKFSKERRLTIHSVARMNNETDTLVNFSFKIWWDWVEEMGGKNVEVISGLGWEERNMELVEAALSGRKSWMFMRWKTMWKFLNKQRYPRGAISEYRHFLSMD